MKTNLIAIFFASAILSCSNSNSEGNEQCSLNRRISFGFADAQYYALPNIDFTFTLDRNWQVREPQFGKQNLSYYEIARYNHDSTGSVLIKVHPFKREGAYTEKSNQLRAQLQWDFHFHVRDSWVTRSKDTVGDWWVEYGIYEQEPDRPHAIAHTLIQRDTLTNGLLLEMILPMEEGNFDLDVEPCLSNVISSFEIHL